MVPMDSFYRIFFYPITFILSPFLTNHITLCLEFCVDMVSNLGQSQWTMSLYGFTYQHVIEIEMKPSMK